MKMPFFLDFSVEKVVRANILISVEETKLRDEKCFG